MVGLPCALYVNKENGKLVRNIVTALVLLLSSFTVWGGSADFVLSYGFLDKDSEGKYYVSKPTSEIPFLTTRINPGFRFGYTLVEVPESERIYKVYSVIKINPHSKKQGQHKESVITTDSIYFSKYHYAALSLEERDIPGVYTIESKRQVNPPCFIPAYSTASALRCFPGQCQAIFQTTNLDNCTALYHSP